MNCDDSVRRRDLFAMNSYLERQRSVIGNLMIAENGIELIILEIMKNDIVSILSQSILSSQRDSAVEATFIFG